MRPRIPENARLRGIQVCAAEILVVTRLAPDSSASSVGRWPPEMCEAALAMACLRRCSRRPPRCAQQVSRPR